MDLEDLIDRMPTTAFVGLALGALAFYLQQSAIGLVIPYLYLIVFVLGALASLDAVCRRDEEYDHGVTWFALLLVAAPWVLSPLGKAFHEDMEFGSVATVSIGTSLVAGGLTFYWLRSFPIVLSVSTALFAALGPVIFFPLSSFLIEKRAGFAPYPLAVTFVTLVFLFAALTPRTAFFARRGALWKLQVRLLGAAEMICGVPLVLFSVGLGTRDWDMTHADDFVRIFEFHPWAIAAVGGASFAHGAVLMAHANVITREKEALGPVA
jgi:hypothetical protein